MRTRIEEPDPFQVGDRVRSRYAGTTTGTIVRLAEDNIVLVKFDDMTLLMAWRVERLQFESTEPPSEDYFA